MGAHVVARLVFDPERRNDRIPLYADGEIEVTGRHSARLSAGRSVSFASYFNAFPAWHWHAHTSVREVALTVRLRGDGVLTVYRSDARGASAPIEERRIGGSFDDQIRISLEPNADGGWIWFDLAADAGPLDIASASWVVEGEPRETRLSTLSMTTMDKPEFALAVLHRIAGEPAALAALDQVVVIDQGRRKVVDDPAFAATSAELGDRLRVIDQANLGGSGGFARGMLEVMDAGVSGSVILLDDDVELEPESLARGVAFAGYTTDPTIVGGHMFDLYRPLRLHAFSEDVTFDDFDWGPGDPEPVDFASMTLRDTPWLHAVPRMDYNGWWFCLIPVEVIRTIGLSMPFFLKWDDAEFSLRAAQSGIPTVSLPGMALWHITWLDKNDALGWQSFYHARNRLVAALTDPRGPGKLLPRKNFNLDVRFLLTMDYHVAEVRHLAYESVLAGPGSLHGELGTRLAQVIATMKRYPSGNAVPMDDRAFPPVEDVRFEQMRTRDLAAITARFTLRQLFTRAGAVPDEPQARISYADARWWKLARYRHVLAVASDRSSYQRHRLDPRLLRRMLPRAVGDYLRMRRSWRALQRAYRAARPELVSEERWRSTLGL